jgi:hypothetical protein
MRCFYFCFDFVIFYIFFFLFFVACLFVYFGSHNFANVMLELISVSCDLLHLTICAC